MFQTDLLRESVDLITALPRITVRLLVLGSILMLLGTTVLNDSLMNRTESVEFTDSVWSQMLTPHR